MRSPDSWFRHDPQTFLIDFNNATSNRTNVDLVSSGHTSLANCRSCCPPSGKNALLGRQQSRIDDAKEDDAVPLPFLTRVPDKNIQVTYDSNPQNDRSESALVVNPLDSTNMVGSSKKFTVPNTYQFSLVAYATFNGGLTWKESPLTLPASINGNAVEGISDPAVAFDDVGTAYLLGMAFNGSLPTDRYQGMVMYMSFDGGASWSAPNVIHVGTDDKQSMGADLNNSTNSAYHGNLYVAWDDVTDTTVRFARSTNHGGSWKGVSVAGVDQPTGSLIISGAALSTISVDAKGHVWVFAFATWPDSNGNPVGSYVYVTSSDGGATFSAVQPAVVGITLPPNNLPGATFRVEPIPTSCVTGGTQLVVAWTDYRNQRAEIYYRRTNPAGTNWQGNISGDLLTAAAPSSADQHDFMPQLAATPDGEIGCCFYEFGPKPGSTKPLIDVVTVLSIDNGVKFNYRLTVTDQPWDPTVDYPTDEFGNSFIGDYFGFAASPNGFFPFWTDTRTKVQELFTSGVYLVTALFPKIGELAIDPLALILHGSAYLTVVELKHPHEPKIADIRAALQGMTPQERKDALSRARTLADYGKAVEEAFGTK